MMVTFGVDGMGIPMSERRLLDAWLYLIFQGVQEGTLRVCAGSKGLVTLRSLQAQGEREVQAWAAQRNRKGKSRDAPLTDEDDVA
jgi:hypothetical protein